VMQPVKQVKFSPLIGSEWSKKRMIEQSSVRAEAILALVDPLIARRESQHPGMEE